jgi:hypothetical protein
MPFVIIDQTIPFYPLFVNCDGFVPRNRFLIIIRKTPETRRFFKLKTIPFRVFVYLADIRRKIAKNFDPSAIRIQRPII